MDYQYKNQTVWYSKTWRTATRID